MNIFNDIYNETEKEDDWGWFIRLDLDNTTPMTNKKTNYICKNLQTIHENQEYHDTTMKTLPTRYTQYKNPVFNIDFMSVDCEGLDMEVLESNDWDIFRPKLICIEHSIDKTLLSNFMNSKNYTKIYENIGNTFYETK
jgi:hypothetical protein